MTTRFHTAISLDPDTRARIVETLNTALAEIIDLRLQTKQAHWNVRGPFFFARHELFDALAERRRAEADTIAERAGSLGGYAEGSIRWAAENSRLPAYPREAVSGGEHLRALIDAYSTFSRHARSWISQVGEVDPVTEDVLIETVRQVELDLWFLESHVQG